MASGAILAGGAGTRMPGDKVFMEVSGRRVIDIQLEVLRPLCRHIQVIGNCERMEKLGVYCSEGVEVVEESVRGMGPLGGIASALELSREQEVFVVACDMPFIRPGAVALVLDGLKGFDVSVPRTAAGIEPLHAAYRTGCLPVIMDQLQGGNLKVSGFFSRVKVNYIPFHEPFEHDPRGRLLVNINTPEDMRRAAGIPQQGGREQRRYT